MSFTHAGRAIDKVAVIGSGQIGPDIALYFTKVLSPHGVSIVVVDVAEDALQRGQEKLSKKIQKGVETGAFSPEQQQQMESHVTFTSDYEQVRGADFVLEAAYGRVLARPGLDALTRELLAVTALLALDQVPQLVAHARGALHFGADREAVAEAMRCAGVTDEHVITMLRRV